MKDITKETNIITRTMIIKDLKNLGICPGQVLMLHVSVKAIGWILGGPDIVLQAIIDLITKKGTLMMMVSWEDEDNIYDLLRWPEKKQHLYLKECPPFDPRTSRANRKYSILAEYLRTRQGAYRSRHPEASFAAIGSKAKWITKNHPLNYGYGIGSPLSKLCDAGGKVLMLGAPLNSVTLLHYAECLADVPNKKIVNYRLPILKKGKRVWVEIEEYDTSDGIVDWPNEDYFSIICREYILSGKGTCGKVGSAQSYLFDAENLVEFAKEWMEKNFADL